MTLIADVFPKLRTPKKQDFLDICVTTSLAVRDIGNT